MITVTSTTGSSRSASQLDGLRAQWAGEAGSAAVVLAGDEPQPEQWAQVPAPVLVVLPPRAPASSVIAAFAAGADACVCTASTAEITAHVRALLRRQESADVLVVSS